MLHKNEIILSLQESYHRMNYIDTHTHLYDEAFEGEKAESVTRAIESGVCKMILPDIDSSTRKSMFSLAAEFPGILLPSIGLHPTSINSEWKKEIEQLDENTGTEIYAIGETGMDCYWSKEFLNEQKEAFEYQLHMADKLSLPVIVHSREATEPIFDVLEKCRHLNLKGVFHAYSGSFETFERLQKYGDWYIGIGGVVTYKNASIAETVKKIPAERILLETDSPYLTPVPKRGSRNESSYIHYIAEKIAIQKGIDKEEIATITSENARKLFNI